MLTPTTTPSKLFPFCPPKLVFVFCFDWNPPICVTEEPMQNSVVLRYPILRKKELRARLY